MGLRISQGDMYDFVTHTWNPVKGKCYHNCSYCYMGKCERIEKDIRLDADEFKTNLGEGNFIFVGSGIDLFADDIPEEWIKRTLDYCNEANNKLFGAKNKYLFQSKNPMRIYKFIEHPVFEYSVVCTTIETNRNYPDIMRKSPPIESRVDAMSKISSKGVKTYVTTEPLMEFDLDQMIDSIKQCEPSQVNFGRNTNWKAIIPEPNSEDIKKLIEEVAKFTETIVIKKNLYKKYNEDLVLYYNHEKQKLIRRAKSRVS